MCPYDSEALDPAVVEDARRTHPFLTQGDLVQIRSVPTGTIVRPRMRLDPRT